jgi:hypothetical protein
LAGIQVTINDVARSIDGYRRDDHIPVEDLLEAAKFMSLNQLFVRATAMAARNAHVSDDGVAGTRNPVGQRAYGEANQGNGGRRGQGPNKSREHPLDQRA